MTIYSLYSQHALRNFTYIIALENNQAIIIDPWDELSVQKILSKHHLKPICILNTHEHWDHTQGNAALVRLYGCEVWGHPHKKEMIPGFTKALYKNDRFPLDSKTQLHVLETPGHTVAHLCFVLIENGEKKAIFSGDTLFNAGVGNCHNGGDPYTLYQTIQTIMPSLPEGILIYPGHDYLRNNLLFTLAFDPFNRDAKKWLKKVESNDYSSGKIVTRLSDEKQINLFLRLDSIQKTPLLLERLLINENKYSLPSSHTLSKKMLSKNAALFIALRKQRDQW
jgi:hydroxyacylglutathione hydrolase